MDGDDNTPMDDSMDQNNYHVNDPEENNYEDMSNTENTHELPEEEPLDDEANMDLDSLLEMADKYANEANAATNESPDNEGNDYSGGGADGVDGPDDNIPGINMSDFDDPMNELPEWASSENKALNEMIKRKSKLLEETRRTIQENIDRIAVMKEHLKNVRTEHNHTQSLLDVKRKEREEESHKQKLSERTIERLKGELKQANDDVNSYRETLNRLQANTLSAKERLERYRAELQWNQEELIQWSLAARQKEEDLDVIKQYEQQDNKRVVELTEELKRETRLSHEASTSLQAQVAETKAIQVELDSLASALREEHKQRQDMLQRWNAAVKSLHKRDEQVVNIGEEMQSLRSELDEAQIVLRNHERQLEKERYLRTNSDRNLEAMEREVVKFRTLLTNTRQEVEELQDITSTHRGESAKLNAEVNDLAFLNTNLNDLKAERTRKLDEYRQLVRATQEQLNSGIGDTAKLRDKSAAMEGLFKRHQSIYKDLVKELEQAKKTLFQKSKNLHDLRTKEAEYVADISAAQSACSNLQTRIKALDQQALKKQEMLYEVEFRVQKLERDVSRAAGKRTVEETMALTQQLTKLQSQVALHEREHAMLVEQIHVVEDEVRTSRAHLTKLQNERNAAYEELSRLELEVSTTNVVLEKSTRERNEKVIQHSKVSVEANKLGDELTAKRDVVKVLQAREKELALALKEKNQELRSQEMVNKAEIKAAEEARNDVIRDLRERETRLAKLNARYQTLQTKAGTDTLDQQGEFSSQAAMLVREAQTREMLQRQGDELKDEIIKKQKELLLLAKTLDTLQQRQSAMKNHKVEENSKEARTLRELTRRYNDLRAEVDQHKMRCRDLEADLEARKSLLTSLTQQIQEADHQIESYAERVKQLQQEVVQAQERLQRAERSAQLAKAELRGIVGVAKGDVSVEEVYVNVMETRKRISIAKEMLNVLVQQHPDLLPNCIENGIEVAIDTGRNTPGAVASPGRPNSSGLRNSSGRASNSSSFAQLMVTKEASKNPTSIAQTRKASAYKSPSIFPPIK